MLYKRNFNLMDEQIIWMKLLVKYVTYNTHFLGDVGRNFIFLPQLKLYILTGFL